MTQTMLSPWLRWLDSARYHDHVERVRSLGVQPRRQRPQRHDPRRAGRAGARPLHHAARRAAARRGRPSPTSTPCSPASAWCRLEPSAWLLGPARRDPRWLPLHLRIHGGPRHVGQAVGLVTRHQVEQRLERLRLVVDRRPTGRPAGASALGHDGDGEVVGVGWRRPRPTGSGTTPAATRGPAPTTARTRSCAGRSG